MMFVEYGDLIETLRDCANALDELLPRDHAYRKIVEQANRLIDRHDCRTTQDVRADAHLIAACDPDTIRALLEERDTLAAKVASYERAERDINEALNMGNGSYVP